MPWPSRSMAPLGPLRGDHRNARIQSFAFDSELIRKGGPMSDTMQAVVKAKAAPGAEIQEVKVPGFGRTDVLVKVKVASICGTDLHIYEWDRWAQNRIHPPLIPGHEFCGEVVAFGDEVTCVKEGDFVSAEMHVACGKCLQCRTG